jgi:hypothetical protein
MPLPTVAGTLVLDINPGTWGLAPGTALTFANSGLTPVGASPTITGDYYGVGIPAIKVVQGVQGFSVPRPVADDFTIYGVVSDVVGSGTGGNWWQNGTLIDCESPGVANDFGLSLRSDGKLSGGVGNPDVTGTGTVSISNAVTHYLVMRRVKATGLFRVYRDSTLDASVTGNTNSLTANANMYFGSGASAGSVGGFYGRILVYDAAHSDSDRALVEAYLLAEHPEPPWLRATKFNGYAIASVPASNLAATKFDAYGVTGAGNPGTLSSTKFIAYGVIVTPPPSRGARVRLVHRPMVIP